jgi:hypothetical protein
MKKYCIIVLLVAFFANFNIVEAQVQTGVFKTAPGNTDYHHFTRENATGAAVYVNQVSNGPILRLSSGTFDANQGVKFTFENNGYLGVGTNVVTEKLVLYKTDATPVVTQYGNANTDIGTGNGFIVGIQSGGNGIVWNRENNFIRFGTNATERMRINADGTVDVLGILKSKSFRSAENNIEYHHFTRDNATGAAVYINQLSTGPILRLSSGIVNPNQNVKFTIENNGSVGIGTLNLGNYMLAVNGKIRAKEIRVDTDWADFVFEEHYRLPTLQEVEGYIQEKGHLKDIPSAQEVAENGISLGEMDAKLLQKIEELTLYMIEQNAKTEQLLEKVKELEQENQTLKEKMENLEAQK